MLSKLSESEGILQARLLKLVKEGIELPRLLGVLETGRSESFKEIEIPESTVVAMQKKKGKRVTASILSSTTQNSRAWRSLTFAEIQKNRHD